MSFSNKITTRYCWFNDSTIIIKVFFINGFPFTFDDLPDGYLYDLDIVKEANDNQNYELEDMYRYSSYLIEEEAHPMLFPIELENPQDLPDFEHEL
jgi:hypothetical protein